VLTPAGLWATLDAETRRLAAQAVYDRGNDDRAVPIEADAGIAAALNFRLVAVRRLPVERRVDYLTRVVRPKDPLASLLLRELHLAHRRPLLVAFLDALAIPHAAGVIEADLDPQRDRPEAARLKAAIDKLDASFTKAEIDLYLSALVAMDPAFWSSLAGLIEQR
jgi:hypothetical protein